MTGRRVEIAFDSDAAYKPSVQGALRVLCRQLIDRGANPFDVQLPPLPGSAKVGADDFLVHHRRRARKAWDALHRVARFVPEGETAADLLVRDLPPLRPIVKELFYVGLATLSGAPKLGKSRLTRQIAADAASGETVLGVYEVAPGIEVALLALEDTPARLKQHLEQLNSKRDADLSGLHVFTHWPPVEALGLEALDRFLQERPKCKLVIIDTLAKLRARPDGGGQLYYQDYDAISALKRIADAHAAAIVVVHHTRKAPDADIFNTISGSTGISGSADTNIVLIRGRGEVEAELHVTGRDLEEKAVALGYEGGIWRVIGPAAEHRKSQARKEILDAFRALGRPAKPAEIADCLNRKRDAVRRTIVNMAVANELRPLGDGKYELPQRTK